MSSNPNYKDEYLFVPDSLMGDARRLAHVKSKSRGNYALRGGWRCADIFRAQMGKFYAKNLNNLQKLINMADVTKALGSNHFRMVEDLPLVVLSHP